ncbi:hypothetical protein OM076_25315 [Solirubrobacter ginsenosidimutans]|uniref:Uncharacterized protein n=1 Tax=Solirubrobacter ginsenosidimutans TaxID=490573 RepID=A0A9X3S7P1_9ACTN|nr:hypothetical protein [Solirubrobacter ginsenosidimutans]MDA0163618.1 hypothetical protein [Solirubrobacter ginsenosidimutans]
MIGDVTPVGWRAGPTRRKRGPLRIIVGLALLIAGGVAVVIGITGAVTARSAIEDNAVARAPLGQPTSFRAEAGQRYTVYVIFSGGVFSNTDRQEQIIARTACETSSGAQFRGAFQGSSVTLGSASTVGRFTAPGGEISVNCAGPSTDAYVVTPGGTGIFRSIIEIIAGAFGAVGGLLLLIWGLIGRRVPA